MIDVASSRPSAVDATAILRDLQDLTYQQVADKHAVSRGTVYAIAVKAGARKHEQLIQQKQADRKQLQREFLQSVINATQTSDALDFLAGLPTGSVALHHREKLRRRRRRQHGVPLLSGLHAPGVQRARAHAR